MRFSPIQPFFDSPFIQLKVCGVTQASDAEALADLGIHALGVNFWPQSKRFIVPEKASSWLLALKGRIVRVGVFVNEEPKRVQELLEADMIDIAQFHGDESALYCQAFATQALPFIKAFGVKDAHSLRKIPDYHTDAVLLDAPAPHHSYGGTGSVFDWDLADLFTRRHKNLNILLAGGITVDNIQQAATLVRPAWIDVASGSELSPGKKDLELCARLQDALLGISREHPPEDTDIPGLKNSLL